MQLALGITLRNLCNVSSLLVMHADRWIGYFRKGITACLLHMIPFPLTVLQRNKFGCIEDI